MRISIWQLLKNIKSFCEAKCWQHACHITWDNVHDLYGAYSLIENPFKSTSSNHLPNAQWEQSNNGRSRSDSSIDWVGQKAIMAQIFILRVAQGTKGGNAWWVARIEVNDKNPCCHPQPTRGYLHWPHLKVPGCHGMPCPPCPHAPNHLRSSPTSSAYTLVSLWCTLRKLTQPCHSCHWTKLGSMSNFPALSPYVSGHRLFVFFSICRICLMHFHWW